MKAVVIPTKEINDLAKALVKNLSKAFGKDAIIRDSKDGAVLDITMDLTKCVKKIISSEKKEAEGSGYKMKSHAQVSSKVMKLVASDVKRAEAFKNIKSLCNKFKLVFDNTGSLPEQYYINLSKGEDFVVLQVEDINKYLLNIADSGGEEYNFSGPHSKKTLKNNVEKVFKSINVKIPSNTLKFIDELIKL